MCEVNDAFVISTQGRNNIYGYDHLEQTLHALSSTPQSRLVSPLIDNKMPHKCTKDSKCF